ncbi:MAG TPA: hypothetical protein VGS41_02665, partial [Chthonomonadales bacterium]|nr:hypothetical protein [Chthonomonadales bacterium]
MTASSPAAVTRVVIQDARRRQVQVVSVRNISRTSKEVVLSGCTRDMWTHRLVVRIAGSGDGATCAEIWAQSLLLEGLSAPTREIRKYIRRLRDALLPEPDSHALLRASSPTN